jgi:hypothetical protein
MLAFLFLVLAACSTTYQPTGFRGGFSEIPLSANAYRITAAGNAFTSAEKINQMALVRAAELTLQRGFYSFAVMDQQNWEKRGTIQTAPGYYNSTTSATVTGFGNRAFGTAQTTGTYSGPEYMDYSKPNTAMVVVMFRQDEPGSDRGLLPEKILAQYGPLVGYEPPPPTANGQ